ncbi:MAG: HNH endonuclease [Thaumarchaeota archaeon]|nr:HNH endonuclease [Nitrososphaerota archaeon]
MIKKKPHFTIKNNSQKGGYRYSDILTPEILQDVCKRVTGLTEYTYEFDNSGYNKGRLAKIEYDGEIIYVSFSETKVESRNSFFQSMPTALIAYHSDSKKRKRICFYFMPSVRNHETDYFMFMYRLMKTAGIEFLNLNKVRHTIVPFYTGDDIIAIKDKIRSRNSSNNSTYITRNSEGITEIYGKTYGANKYESTLLCLATSSLVKNIKLYEIVEQNLSELPKPALDLIKSLRNIEVIPTDLTMEKKEFEDNNSLRSPRFIFNLGAKLGAKKCAFCQCEVPELIAGAHIWSVSDIKRNSRLGFVDKIKHAINGDNGIWLCENHHKMLDNDLLRISENGELKHLSKLDKKSIKFIKETTTIIQIEKTIIDGNFARYLKERNKLIPEKNYVSLCC